VCVHVSVRAPLNAWVGGWVCQEDTYLPAFQAGVERGHASGLMCSCALPVPHIAGGSEPLLATALRLQCVAVLI
jgi:hypothetical protein